MIYFTSDEHQFHHRIIEYCNRPYTDVDHMAKELIANHNSVVNKDDVVYHIGDFSLSKDVVPEVLSQLNGKHYLIAGNHDRCHPDYNHKKRVDKQVYIDYGFEDVALMGEVEGFRLCHFPDIIEPEYKNVKDRFAQYRPNAKEGEIILCGHVHSLFSERGQFVNVGVDVRNYTPISIEEIRKLCLGKI